MLLCALAPCFLFGHTMATLVAPVFFLLHPVKWGLPLLFVLFPSPLHPELSPPPGALRPLATHSFFVAANHVGPLNPMTPPLLPPTPVEEAPFVGVRSPCF